jgi:hypothetical protein
MPKPRRGSVAFMRVEWEPDVPERLSDDEMQDHRTGRDTALNELGMRALVVEV